MKRSTLAGLVLLTFCASGCRDLVTPALGWVVVENILSPVQIITEDLEGAGWIKAKLPNGQWKPIFISPGGGFSYHEPLPPEVWHCNPANGSDGCVAQLQVGDEKGFFGTGKPEGSIYVCTENYVQKVGRKHCGARGLFAGDLGGFQRPKTLGVIPDVIFAPRSTSATASYGDDPHATYWWDGDPMSRFYLGFDGLTDNDRLAHHPPEERIVSDWHEWPYSIDGYDGPAPVAVDGVQSVSVDIGACSLFIPYKWEDRLDDPIFTPKIGELTEDLGVAEIMVQGILDDPPEPTYEMKDNVMLWMDASAFVKTDTTRSPEFHFRVSASGQPQMCLKTYMRASTSLQSGIDAWYRWDQGFLSALASLFNIGECREHPASLMYCGHPYIDNNGKGAFKVDPNAIWVNIEGYSVFKPACRNQFVPSIKEEFTKGAKTTGQQNISDGIDQFVSGFRNGIKEVLGLDIQPRRLELTPSGIYVVLAQDTNDPQFGFGHCVGDLYRRGHGLTQPAKAISFTNRGITREVQP